MQQKGTRNPSVSLAYPLRNGLPYLGTIFDFARSGCDN